MIVTILLVLVIIVFIRLNDYIAYHPSATSNYEVRESSDEFYSELTKLITTASYKDDLFISIGEGESLNDWLSRIFEENNAGRINSLQIRNIYIKMLSPELCELLEKNHFLSDGFSARMNKNVHSFCENQYLKDHSIDVKLTYWTKLPTFHGFIYDGYCLVNKWEVNDKNNLHVRTL